MAKRNFPEKKKRVETFEEPAVAVTDQIQEILAALPILPRGVVSGCKMLNVRSEPDISGVVVGLLFKDDEVAIIEEKSTDEWYYIRGALQEGFCMRKYIRVNE